MLFHLFLAVLFFFIGLKYLEPPPPEEGIAINFGWDEQGLGNEIKEEKVSENKTDNENVTNLNTQSNTEKVNEKVIKQNIEESVVLNDKEENTNNEKKETNEAQPDKKLIEALNKWKKNESSNSKSQGINNRTGNQGKADGDINSDNYSNGNKGNSTIFSLAGRRLIKSPKIYDTSQKEGRVVVEIIVDKYGNVIKATPGARGTTTTDNHLFKLAKNAAMATKFNPDPDAPEQQKGTITYIFILD